MASESLITIAVIIALQEEHEVFLETFPFKSDHSSEKLICLEHHTGNTGVRLISVLAEQMGAHSARSSADFAMENFDPDLIAVVGIAGGLSKDLSVGDVCVSNEILDVLNNNKFFDEDGKTDCAFSPDFYNVRADLVAAFTFFRSHPSMKKFYDAWTNRLAENADKINWGDELEISRPKMHIGPVACGPVSASPQFNEKIKKLHRKVAAIETEAGGVFQQIADKQIPAIAIRGISDLADDNKAELEKITNGDARRFAMGNATQLLKSQLDNRWFLDVAKRYAQTRWQENQNGLFPDRKPRISIVAEIEKEVKARLKDLCPDFRARPEGFYLPIPRASRVSYTDELSGRKLENPQNIVECLKSHKRSIVKMPRSFPSQALGWVLAHSLLRQQIDGKVILPFVIDGTSIKPPKSGLESLISEDYRKEAANAGDEYIKVFIVEEPAFESRSRMKFFSKELEGTDAKVMVLTKSEDHVATVNDFISENAMVEFELTPVSFSETAYFLERAFDMSPHEAEQVAIRLDDTFRKFRLEAHPTYFAGLQEETLAALINANKRAELIQLAVDGLLTMIVAADNSKINLSRTTRERFLKQVVLKIASDGNLDDAGLSKLAREFLQEHKFDVSQTEFLTPFFQIGLLYQTDGKIRFTHPYLESYLLAQSLREFPEQAREYFNPAKEFFNYYAFDLYCEMGPDELVIDAIKEFSHDVIAHADDVYSASHIYLEPSKNITTLSSPEQLKSLARGLVKSAEKMESGLANDDVRLEKQRLLDARRQVRSVVNSRDPGQLEKLPDEIRKEFEILDGLSRSLSLCITAVGSGSEALNGETKILLSDLALSTAAKFTDVWTRNRLRIDFEQTRTELLSDENVWKFMEEIGAEDSAFDQVKSDLGLYLHEVEMHTVLEPMARVLWRISSSASVRVLAPILDSLKLDDPMQEVIRGCWYMDVEPEKGKQKLKQALNEYKGNSLLRIVLAGHLLARLFWHHYKTAGANHFVTSARRALSPIGLKPNEKRVEEAKKGIASNQ